MKYLCLLLSFAALFASCGEECYVERSSYNFEVTINNERRKAIIVKPSNSCVHAPILFYFHGRGGTAQNGYNNLKFHENPALDHMYIVYAEGTNYDSNPNGSNAWVIRFPHISTDCTDKNKDLLYIDAIIENLEEDPKANTASMGAMGHSNGGFFTLSLSQLWPHKFKYVAAHGCYASYAPFLDSINCDNSYRPALFKEYSDSLNALMTPNPVPTLFIMPDSDSTLHTNNIPKVYKPDCNDFSYFQNTVVQLCIKNKSEMPLCDRSNNFMSDYNRQVYPAKTGGEETQVQLYVGNHSWTPQVTDWMVEYFVDRLD